MAETAITRIAGQITQIDIALNSFRNWLPAHGFKLVMPPPTPGSVPRAFASVWRRGDAQAFSHSAGTAAGALLRAAEAELMKLYDASALAACGRCRGVGWCVTNNATVEICRHTQKSDFHAG
jgi:hypothetical protein